VTVKLTVVVGARPPPLAVTVIGYVPIAVVDPTEMVMAEVPPPGAGMPLGLNATVVPKGTPEALKLTALLKEPPMVVVMVDEP